MLKYRNDDSADKKICLFSGFDNSPGSWIPLQLEFYFSSWLSPTCYHILMDHYPCFTCIFWLGSCIFFVLLLVIKCDQKSCVNYLLWIYI